MSKKLNVKGKPHLACVTQFTREQMEGKSDPQRDMNNYKASQKAQRKKRWEQKQADKKKNAA